MNGDRIEQLRQWIELLTQVLGHLPNSRLSEATGILVDLQNTDCLGSEASKIVGLLAAVNKFESDRNGSCTTTQQAAADQTRPIQTLAELVQARLNELKEEVTRLEAQGALPENGDRGRRQEGGPAHGVGDNGDGIDYDDELRERINKARERAFGRDRHEEVAAMRREGYHAVRVPQAAEPPSCPDARASNNLEPSHLCRIHVTADALACVMAGVDQERKFRRVTWLVAEIQRAATDVMDFCGELDDGPGREVTLHQNVLQDVIKACMDLFAEFLPHEARGPVSATGPQSDKAGRHNSDTGSGAEAQAGAWGEGELDMLRQYLAFHFRRLFMEHFEDFVENCGKCVQWQTDMDPLEARRQAMELCTGASRLHKRLDEKENAAPRECYPMPESSAWDTGVALIRKKVAPRVTRDVSTAG